MRFLFCLRSVYALVLFILLGSLLAQTPNSQSDPRSSQAPALAAAPAGEITVPGPLRSLLRMAGVSQKASPDEVIPLIARNIYVQGYVGWTDGGTPTEFLTLLGRYVNQAKELSALAGPDQTIRVSNCEQAVPLLRILGYRLRQTCGQRDATVITSDPERAFLTTDSGFPLSALEEDLQRGKPFAYAYPVSRVPIMFSENDWVTAVKGTGQGSPTLLEALIHHPLLARLYWALSRNDPETREYLHRSIGLKRLLPLSPVMDYYGSQLVVRSGRVEVPGGPSAEAAWKDIVGAGPDSASEFAIKLFRKDNGWLADYYDCVARINQEQQRHFVEGHRLQNNYAAFRREDPSSEAARSAFRRAPDLLLLMTRQQWDSAGQPLVPGSLDLWNAVMNQGVIKRRMRHWNKHGKANTPDQLLEDLFAFSRRDGDDSPVQMYLAFSELEGLRTPDRRLKEDTLWSMAKRYDDYSDQYLIFSEFPQLDDSSILKFISTADGINKISNHSLRGNAMGTFQASIGLWQIFARQQQIPAAKLNDSWREVIRPFARIGTAAQLFEAGKNSVAAISLAVAGRPDISEDEIVDLLAGPHHLDAEGQRVHDDIAKNIRNVMDSQRLVSLDTLLALGKGLSEIRRGSPAEASLAPLASELREFQMPRAMFTFSERLEWAAGTYNNSHTDAQMKTDISKALRPSASPGQIEEARGQLASFLRDTLVGLNYAYYQPPSAQLLQTNSLLVRSHDFAGETVAGVEGLWRVPQLFGQGSPAGGGAHLVGSLADLPYALSDAEQDFIAPENVQALIWKEAVPVLLADSIVPRWWNVSRNELHVVTLYQRAGEELVSASLANADLRKKVMAILGDRMVPQRTVALDRLLSAGQLQQAMQQITPADTLYITAEFRERFPKEEEVWGASGKELDALSKEHPNELNWQRLSRDFGVPHKSLAQNYGRELINVKPFPAFSGYSSRLMAESWDSNNLYWARLADEKGYSPVLLNRLAPELTRRMVAKIFATDFEDWPALLRAMRETGEDFRQGKIAVDTTVRAAATGLSTQ